MFKLNNWFILILIILIGAFYIATLRPGHVWGDDFALYIQHAINIAEGRPYAQSGYILDPQVGYSPRAYPPVTAFLLAPIYTFCGFNLGALKTVLILSFVSALLVLYALIRGRISDPGCIAFLLIAGAHPVFYTLKDSVLSEFPFIFFTYLSFWLVRKYTESRGPAVMKWAVLAGCAFYLACGTREIGVMLIPIFLLYDIFRIRLISGGAIMTVAVSLSLILMQNYFFPGVGDYGAGRGFGSAGLQISSLIANCLKDLIAFVAVWESDLAGKAQWMTVIVTAALSLKGFFDRVFRKIEFEDLFFVSYCFVIMILPFADVRYFVPVLPLYIFYFIRGVESLSDRVIRGLPLNKLAFVLLAGLLFWNFTGYYARMDFGPVREGPYKQESQDLFRFVREHTPQDAIFIFYKPRALALYTGRKAVACTEPADTRKLWDLMARNHVQYLVADKAEYMNSFVGQYQDRLNKVYDNPAFSVYRIVF